METEKILNKIYNEDCIDTIQRIPDNYIDLVVTSPPYNVDLGNNKYNNTPYDVYNDNKEHSEYILWLKNIFKELYCKIKKGGRICINIGDGKNGIVPTHSDIIQFMNDLTYLNYGIIVWSKSQIGNRTAWGSFKSPSCPSFPTPFEYILIFAKESRKLQWKGETDLTKQEFIDWSLALWNFKPETNQKDIGHNAMFPVELPKRCIKMLSWKESVVYDPFCGAGTTCLEANRLNRYYIGSEISSQYCQIANNRLK